MDCSGHGAGLDVVGDNGVVQRAMRFDVTDRRPGGVSQRLQRADLVDDIGGEILGADIDVASAEAGQVAIAHLGADPNPPLRGGSAHFQQPGGVAGMESAGDVRAGDQVEHRLVVTQAPDTEALAQIGIEVHRAIRAVASLHRRHARQPRLVAVSTRDSTRDDVLITYMDLARLIAAGPVTLLDVRWQLARPDGRDDYLAGHLPDAVYVSLDDELSDHSITDRGRHPLPSGAALQAAARRWGVREGVPTVIYDDWNLAGASRAWWVLSAAGIEDVRILDGGLAAWATGGGPLDTGEVDAEPGDVTVTHLDLYTGAMPTLTADQSGALGNRLADARAPERFRGETEPVDPVAGHIPGALNVPSTSLLAVDGTVRSDLVVPDVDGVYCGSGVTAAVAVAAWAAAGRQVALFPGSWSQWCAEGRAGLGERSDG